MYDRDDLRDGWEFKIVRSTLGSFSKPAVMRRVVEQESQAGWQLLEKFDDHRLRFKRPASARDADELLPKGIDPYCTRYGPAEIVVALGIVVVIVLAILTVMALAAAGRAAVQ